MFPYEEQAEHLQHSATLIFQSIEIYGKWSLWEGSSISVKVPAAQCCIFPAASERKHIMVTLLFHVSKHRQGRKCSHGWKRAQEEKSPYWHSQGLCVPFPTAGAMPGTARGSHRSWAPTASMGGPGCQWVPSFCQLPCSALACFIQTFPITDQSCEPRLNFSLVVTHLHLLLPRLLDKLVASHIRATAALSPELPDPGVPGGFGHEEQSEVQLLCTFLLHSPVQSSVLHTTAPGRARAAGWGRSMQEWVVWAVGLSELGASRTKGRTLLRSSERAPRVCPVIHIGHIPSALLSHWKIKEAMSVIEGRVE